MVDNENGRVFFQICSSYRISLLTLPSQQTEYNSYIHCLRLLRRSQIPWTYIPSQSIVDLDHVFIEKK